MDNKQIARELLKTAKSLMSWEKVALSRDFEKEIGKASVSLVDISNLIMHREKDIESEVRKKLFNQLQKVIKELDKFDDMVNEIR